MKFQDREALFKFMLGRVAEVSQSTFLKEPQAFVRWFAGMNFQNVKAFHSDGSSDGKVDAFLKVINGNVIKHYVINAKWTRSYDKTAPATFYSEIAHFYQIFADPDTSTREDYLGTVKAELRVHYRELFAAYDDDDAELIFITSCKLNPNQYLRVKKLPVTILHQNDLLRYLLDDLDIAMPRTKELVLNGIHQTLKAAEEDTEVSTTIVFARVFDFLEYMQDDPFDLLFARNVRLTLGNTDVNTGIARTFKEAPEEFVFSNNGITLICDRYSHTSKNLTIENPRVVNGSQTLHSLRDIGNPSKEARVMVRIIELPELNGDQLAKQNELRKQTIEKIAVRSNRQNPIKSWDLVANDDFQLDVFRFFRERRIFYERRQKEWAQRSRQLASDSLRKGPNIKALSQLIACYHFDKSGLGPAEAKRSVKRLFDYAAYRVIKRTTPDTAYQLYVLSQVIDDAFSQLGSKYQKFGRHIDLTLFAVIVRVFKVLDQKFGRSEMTEWLDDQWNYGAGSEREWRRFVRAACDIIIWHYRRESNAYRTSEKRSLPLNYFFKTQGYLQRLMTSGLSGEVKTAARAVLKQ